MCCPLKQIMHSEELKIKFPFSLNFTTGVFMAFTWSKSCSHGLRTVLYPSVLLQHKKMASLLFLFIFLCISSMNKKTDAIHH